MRPKTALQAPLATQQQFNATLQPGVPVPGPPGPAGPAGTFSTQALVTGQRAANTTYQNAGASAMLVSVCWDMSSKSANISALSDANNPPVTEVAQVADTTANSGVTAQIFFLVLPGNYYACSITGGTPPLVSWVEYA